MTNHLAHADFQKLVPGPGPQRYIAPAGRVIRSANRQIIPASKPANADALPVKRRNIIRQGSGPTLSQRKTLGVNLGKMSCVGFLIGTMISMVLFLPSGAIGGISSSSIRASMQSSLSQDMESPSEHIVAHARRTIRATASHTAVASRKSVSHAPELVADRIPVSANIGGGGGGDRQRVRLASFVAVPQEHQARQAIFRVEPKATTSTLAAAIDRPVARGVVARVQTIIRKYAPKHQSSQELAHAIVSESRNQGYDPLFVAAVIKAESTFNAAARSHKGAQGLMQIMPATGAWLAKRNDLPRGRLTDPGHNLRLGISYLKHLESEYSGDKVFTLVAYNWGPGHVQSAAGGKRRIPKECMTYARKILQDYQRWQSGLI